MLLCGQCLVAFLTLGLLSATCHRVGDDQGHLFEKTTPRGKDVRVPGHTRQPDQADESERNGTHPVHATAEIR